MGKSIDEKIVSMQFDNSQFERSTKETMSTLDKLKEKLNFSGASKGLEEISNASKRVDMGGLSKAVEDVRLKFSALQVMGVTALANITNSAVNAGKRIASALTIQPITTGFSEYETKIGAIQTILANTQGGQTKIAQDSMSSIAEAGTYAASTISNSGQEALKALQKTHDEILDEFEEAADAELAVIQSQYEEKEKLLDKSIKKERKEFQKLQQSAVEELENRYEQELETISTAYDDQRDAVEEAYARESELLQKSHQEKLDVYEEEYMAKLKVIDENRYNEIKAIDDQINAIKDLTKAEKEQKKLEEQQSTIKNLQEKIDTAFNPAEQRYYEEKLAEYQAQLDEERILKERELEIENLELSKDGINDKYDLQVDQIQNEYVQRQIAENESYQNSLDLMRQESEEKINNLNTTYNKERELILENRKYEKELLLEAQEEEADLFNERMAEKKNALNVSFNEEKETIQDRLSEEKSAILEKQQEELNALDVTSSAGMTNISNLKNAAISAIGEVKDEMTKASTLEDVTKALDEMNTYSDKTIYNFGEMAKNLGTFTAAGVDLETSKNAIMGIANLAAVSGSTSQQASTAMYQLSQAMASGSVKLMDWNSIVNAGMGGQVFQEALKETARVNGIAVDEMIANQGSFRESLAEGWLTTDILTQTLEKFTMTTEGLTEAEIDANKEKLKSIGYTDEQIEGIFKMGNTATNAATKVKTFTQLMDTLKESAQSGWSKTWEILIGDFYEAQDLFTGISDTIGGFINNSSDTRNSLLEEVFSSNWSKLKGDISDTGISVEDFKNALIETGKSHGVVTDDMITEAGGFEKSLKAWCGPDIVKETLGNFTTSLEGLSDEQLKNEGYTKDQVEAFRELQKQAEETGTPINELIEDLYKPSGRELVITTISNLFKGLTKTIESISEAWKNIFPPMSADPIYKALENLSKFSEKMILSDEDCGKLTKTFEGLFAVLDIIGTFLSGGLKIAFDVITGVLDDFDLDILDITSSIADVILGISDWIDSSSDLVTTYTSEGIKSVIEFFKSLGDIPAIKTAIEKVHEKFIAFGDYLKDKFSFGTITAFGDTVTDVKDKILDADTLITPSTESLSTGFTNVKDSLKTFADYVTDKLSNVNLGEILATAFGVSFIVSFIQITKLISSASGLLQGLGSIAGSATKGIETFTTTLKGIGKSIKGAISITAKSEAFFTFAKAIAVLAGAIAVLAILDTDKALAASAMLVGVGASMAALLWFISNKCDVKDTLKLTGLMAAISGAVLMLSTSIVMLKGLDFDELIVGLTGVVGLLAGVTAAAILLSQNEKAVVKGSGTLIALASSVLLLSVSLKLLGGMDAASLTASVVAVSTMLLALGTAVSMIGKANGTTKAATTILAMSVAVLLMIKVIKDVSEFTFEEVVAAAATLTAMVVFFKAFSTVLSTTNKMEGSVVKAGVTLFAISAAMLLMVGVIKLVADVPADDLVKGAAVITGFALICTLLVQGVSNAGPNVAKAGVTIIAFSAACLAMSVAIFMLASISAGDLVKATAAMAAITVMFTMLIASTRGAQSVTSTIIALAASLGVIAVAIGALSFIEPEALANATTAVSSVIGMFALLVASTKLAEKATGTVVLIMLVLVEVAAVLALLSTLPADSVLTVAEALSKVLLSMSASMAILSTLSKVVNNKIVTTMVLVGLVMAEAIAALYLLSGLDVDGIMPKLESLGVMLGMISATMGVAALLSGVATKAMTGVLAIGGVIAELAIILAAIGALNQIPGLSDFVSSGGELLVTIGSIIGQFVGSIIGGVGEGITSSLPKMGSDLSLFMENLSGFIEGAKLIDSDMSDGIKALAETVLILTAANVLSGLTALFGGGQTLSDFGKELAEFGPYIKKYSDSIEGIDSKVVTASATAAKALSEVADNLPKHGGILKEWLTGDATLVTFGEELVKFGPKLKTYANSIAGLNSDVIINSANAAKALLEIVNNLPAHGGVIKQWITGDTSLSAFGAELVEFGPKLKMYANSVAGLDAKVVENSADAAKSLLEIANNLPEHGGVIKQWITGDSSLSVFGAELAAFGPNLKAYADSVAGVTPDTIEASSNAAKSLAELANNLPNSGGFLSQFFGDNSMSAFGEQLVSFGQSFSLYYDSVKTISSTTLEAVTKSFSNIVDMAKKIEKIDAKQLGKFGEAMVDVAETGIKKFSETLTGSNTDISKAVSKFIELITNNVKAKYTDIDTCATNLVNRLIESIKKQFTNIQNTGGLIVQNLITGMIAKNSEVETAGSGIVTNIITGINAKKEDLITSFDNLLTAVINALELKNSDFMTYGKTVCDEIKKGIKTYTYLVSEEAKAMSGKVVSEIEGEYSDYKEAGKYLVSGFANGIDANTFTAEAKAKAMATKALKAAKEALGINSPSKEFYKLGEFSEQGFVNALMDNMSDVYDTGSLMGKEAKSGLSEAISKVSEWIDSDMDVNPVIRPVLDLSEVKSKTGMLSSMLSQNKALSINRAMTSLPTEASVRVNDKLVTTQPQPIQFIQNNYSPKALSRLDIYRQTKNQFSAMKGMVKQ
jgi:tape measure domain-containing protein